MDAMKEALKRRKAKGFNLEVIIGSPHEAQKEMPKGDLAPEANADDVGEGDHLAEERKAMHAKENEHLKGAIAENEAGNPEHEPLLRGNGSDEMGHEQSGQDSEFESMMQHGHEHDMLSKPKTLGARVRAALHSKKKGM